MTGPGAGSPAPGPAARQNALAATGARHALFHLAFGPEADTDTLERALRAADRYAAKLRQGAAELRVAGAPRAGPAATAPPVANEERRRETSPPPRGEVTLTVAHGTDRAGAWP